MTNILATIITCLVTNITYQPISIGTRSIPCPDNRPGCCVYHYESIYSPTDKFEIEEVIEQERLNYTKKDGTKGYSIISNKTISKRSRIIEEVVQKSYKTNDWNKMSCETYNWMAYDTNNIYSVTNIVYINQFYEIKGN